MIRSLRLKGFRRYANERFELGPGVCFIDGRNNAGKTTLFLAIEYALFGVAGGARTPSALMRPGATAMGVELVFSGRDQKTYRLQRTHQKPPRSKTKVVGAFTLKEITTSEAGSSERYLLSSDFQDREEQLARKLAEITGISRRAFDVAVHVRQGEIAAILEGDPRLDIVLGITAAGTANEEMRALALGDERAAEALPALQASVAHLTQERDSAEDDQARLEQALAAQRQRIAEQEKALQGQAPADGLEEAVEALAEAMEAVVDATAQEEELGSARTKLQSRHGDPARFAERLATATETLQRLGDQDAGPRRADLLARIRRRRDALAREEAVCEHCGSTIDRKAAQSELAAWETELASLAPDADDTKVTLRLEIQTLQAAQSEVRDQEQALARAHLQRRTAEAAARAVPTPVGSDVEDLAQRLSAMRAARDERRLQGAAQRATAAATRAAAQEAVTDLEERLARHAEQAAARERELARLTAAVTVREQRRRRAGELRTLAAAFRTLQEELRTRAASELAVATLRIHRALAVDDELEALTIDPSRYQVLVTPRDTGVEMPATLAQGGGHRLLIGLAFRLALVERLGPFPFVLLDEPTYGLDDRHRSAMLDRITRLGLCDQILLITHQAMGEAQGQRIRVERPVAAAETAS